jgi:hypothetical protein
MKNLLLTVFFTCLFSEAGSQVLFGTILDKATQQPVEHATIYFSGTSTGVFSDVSGHFAVNISGFDKMPMSVSALGYYSIDIKDISARNHYRIYLEPQTYELSEVIVVDKGTINRTLLRFNIEEFRKQFLGETPNALRCRILNESDLFISSHGDVLKAFAYKPLHITNKSLGYSVDYFLDRFEYHRSDGFMVLLGKTIFTDEAKSMAEPERLKIEKRRRSTYLGSRMHFFRSLWDNTLDSAGFAIIDQSGNEIKYDDIVSETKSSDSIPSIKYLNYRGNLYIKFYSKYPSSILILENNETYFESSGYAEPREVSWNGEMGKKRIGDLLPFDYKVYEPLNEQNKEH